MKHSGCMPVGGAYVDFSSSVACAGGRVISTICAADAEGVDEGPDCHVRVGRFPQRIRIA